MDTRQISRRPWEGLRRLLLWSLDGSSGAGTEARYISANTRTNTSLVSERVRMGSERLSLVFTNGESALLCLLGGKQRHYNGQISTKSGKVTIYHNSLIRVNEAPLIVH